MTQRQFRTRRPARPPVPDSARRLDVYRVTLELIAACQPYLGPLSRFNRRLGAQLTEALCSQRSVGDRYYVLSQSTGELGPRAALDVSRAHWRCENNTGPPTPNAWRTGAAWRGPITPGGLLVVAALRMMGLLILAVTRDLSRQGYSQERPSWSQVIQHYLLVRCDTILETAAFDNV